MVSLFIQHGLIPEVKCICEPIVSNSINLKPTPLRFVCYTVIFWMITFENIRLFLH